MTLEIGFLFLILAAMVFLFLTEKIPVDLTAFAGLVILILFGYLAPDEAFTGFASPAVITMLSIFIVGASLLQTGVADVVGRWVHHLVGGKETPLLITVMVVAAVLSSFMNNIAATAVLMPAVASICRRTGIPPSRLFMPLSFAAILGGTTTMVGTPPNIIATAMLEERGLEPFGLFDFTPFGVILLAMGIVFMLTLGRRLLPDRETGPSLTEHRDLAQVYQLQDRLFSIRVPESSGLDGLSLAEARLGATLGVQVLGISRQGKRQLAPDGRTVLRSGDVLTVGGRLEDLKKILQVQSVKVKKAATTDLPRPIRGVSGFRGVIRTGSELVGRSLRELHFREEFGAVVVGIRREGEMLRSGIADERLVGGDEILATGSRANLERLAKDSNFSEGKVGLSVLQSLESHLYLLRIPQGSPLAGATVAESRLGELVNLVVAGIVRESETRLAVSPEESIREGDLLLVAGEPSRVIQLLELGEVQLDSTVVEPTLESEEIGMAEVTIAPRSAVAGKSLGELKFREHYGLQVLALWREGRLVRTGLAKMKMRFGDALLLQGPRGRIAQLVDDPDFIVLTEEAQVSPRLGKSPFALLGLGLMIAFVVMGLQPIHVAAFTAATFVLLTGAIKMTEAYRAIEWRAIFLVAAVLPVGIAMERTGAATMLAESITSTAGPLGPYAVLASVVVLSSVLSQGLDGAPAVVLLTPVVTQTAEQLGLSPYPLMMGVALAASAAFMTPFSHKANLLVMGAGGYRSLDYVKVGTPLTIVILAVMVLMVPRFFPF